MKKYEGYNIKELLINSLEILKGIRPKKNVFLIKPIYCNVRCVVFFVYLVSKNVSFRQKKGRQS